MKFFEPMLLHPCHFCGKMIDYRKEFRDEISRIEYGISGMCQACQDAVFVLDEPE